MSDKKKEKQEAKQAQKNSDLEERILLYRMKISDSIKEKRVFDLEQTLNELTIAQEINEDDIRLYHALRMDIINGQIFLAKFFQWKDKQRKQQADMATKALKSAIRED